MEKLTQELAKVISSSGWQVRLVTQISSGVFEASLVDGRSLIVSKRENEVWVKFPEGHVERMEIKTREVYGAINDESSKMEVRSMTTGEITSVFVKTGDTVQKDQVLLKIESMKMELEVKAPRDTEVADIKVQLHEIVKFGQVLVSFK